VQPEFVFEGGDGASAGNVASWATEHLKELKGFLIYPFLANGIHIPELRFVAKGTHPLLELADFVCFVVVRYLFRTAEGCNGEIDPCKLGKVTWLVGVKDGTLMELSRQIFPAEQIASC